MPNNVYKVVEIVGSSPVSISDAITNAVTKAGKTLRQLGWFEVVDTRGQIREGKVASYQVTLKLGFTLED